MPKILSTKKLTNSQRELFLNTAIEVDEYDAIHIEYLKKNIPLTEVACAIITSKNAAKVLIDNGVKPKEIFCVGTKTAALLTSKSYNIVKVATNALELAEYIVEHFGDKEFVFFCGNLRREELPTVLKNAGIPLEEVVVYHTKKNSKKIEKSYQGYLFFSPSAAESFLMTNKLGNAEVFCIGETTANYVKKYTSKLTIAEQPTIEETILQAINHFSSSK